MAMPSLFEDCQAWIEKGQESWKSYFTRWETFAKFEENLPESELIQNCIDIHKDRKKGNKKLLKQPISQRRLRTVLFKNQKKRQKKPLKKKKKCSPEIRSKMLCENSCNENSSEIIENKQLEITLTKVFSDFSRANTNIYEMFFGREMTVKDYVIASQKELTRSHFENNIFGLSSMNRKVLSPALSNCLDVRSICPPRNIYLQNLNENLREVHLEQSKWGLQGIGPKKINNFAIVNFNSDHNNQQLLALSGSQTQKPGQNQAEVKTCLSLMPTVFRFKHSDLKSVLFDSNHKFPSSFDQNRQHFRNITIFEKDKSHEDRRLGNLHFQQKTNVSFDVDNAHCMHTPQRRSSQRRYLNKSISPIHTSKTLVSDSKEDDDSDSDDQTVYRSPVIHRSSKRLKVDERGVDAAETDTDVFEPIFDRIVKS